MSAAMSNKVSISGHLKATAQQAHGHPEVVIKSAPHTKGGVVAMVPNGERSFMGALDVICGTQVDGFLNATFM